jgi:hypothetical protein
LEKHLGVALDLFRSLGLDMLSYGIEVIRCIDLQSLTKPLVIPPVPFYKALVPKLFLLFFFFLCEVYGLYTLKVP